VAKQVRNPFRILDIGLATWDGLDVVGVADGQVEVILQDRVDRLPVDAGALHRDVRHAFPGEPVAQGLEVSGHGPERPDLLARSASGQAGEGASNDRRLVDVQTAAAFDDGFHDRLRWWVDRGAAGLKQILPHVLAGEAADKG
jgi:hypothetical protein